MKKALILILQFIPLVLIVFIILCIILAWVAINNHRIMEFIGYLVCFLGACMALKLNFLIIENGKRLNKKE